MAVSKGRTVGILGCCLCWRFLGTALSARSVAKERVVDYVLYYHSIRESSLSRSTVSITQTGAFLCSD